MVFNSIISKPNHLILRAGARPAGTAPACRSGHAKPTNPAITTAPPSIDLFDDHLIWNVFTFLDSTSLLRCESVCSRWRAVSISHSDLWSRFYHNEFGTCVLSFSLDSSQNADPSLNIEIRSGTSDKSITNRSTWRVEYAKRKQNGRHFDPLIRDLMKYLTGLQFMEEFVRESYSGVTTATTTGTISVPTQEIAKSSDHFDIYEAVLCFSLLHQNAYYLLVEQCNLRQMLRCIAYTANRVYDLLELDLRHEFFELFTSGLESLLQGLPAMHEATFRIFKIALDDEEFMTHFPKLKSTILKVMREKVGSDYVAHQQQQQPQIRQQLPHQV